MVGMPASVSTYALVAADSKDTAKTASMEAAWHCPCLAVVQESADDDVHYHLGCHCQFRFI